MIFSRLLRDATRRGSFIDRVNDLMAHGKKEGKERDVELVSGGRREKGGGEFNVHCPAQI